MLAALASRLRTSHRVETTFEPELIKELVRRCNQLGILVDLSHLNERGFWDVAAITQAPLVATHSNAHALCPHSRNLTDQQFAAIRETGGLVG